MSGVGPTTIEQVRATIERAKPFIDDATLPGAWPASALMMIGFCAINTSRRPGCDDRAVEYVNDMLNEARNRYSAGFYANPFEEPVRVRPLAQQEPSA